MVIRGVNIVIKRHKYIFWQPEPTRFHLACAKTWAGLWTACGLCPSFIINPGGGSGMSEQDE